MDGISVTGLSSKDMRDIEAAIRSATSDYSLIPMYQGAKVMKFQNKEFGAQTYGLKPGDIPELVTILSGKVPHGTEGVLIGEKLADDHDLRIGSRLTMTAKNGATKAVRVVGILENTGMSLTFSTDSAIVGTTTWYESIVNTHNLYSSAMVKTGNLDNLDPISSAIEKRLNGRADRDTDNRVSVIDATAVCGDDAGGSWYDLALPGCHRRHLAAGCSSCHLQRDADERERTYPGDRYSPQYRHAPQSGAADVSV